MKLFEGLGVAMITPFKSDRSVDFKALEAISNHIIEGGADYLVVMGTTSEAVTLNQEEKEAVTSYIVELNNGRIPIVLGIGGNNTQQVTDTIKRTDFEGISGILSVAPYYNKPGQKGIVLHFKEISMVSPVPIILYNVPGRTSSNIDAETCLELAWGLDNIIGIKEASGSLSQVMKIIQGKPENFLLISGDDLMALPIITLGGSGVISVLGNAFPAEWKEMVSLALKSKIASARDLHYKYTELIDLLFVEGNPAGIKSVMSMLGLCQNNLRLPLTAVSRQTGLKINTSIENLRLKASV
ncbi:MAG: 4-hydroxy-tetrahydrodipicolinate synthase [Bacteroidales bacterium]|jgi:4-hydroxy-tetrahydrodipicolinate synthase|nr:4-hydroxy-tetrahydrodipicolinate synthase [Bacteroidales bacterium]